MKSVNAVLSMQAEFLRLTVKGSFIDPIRYALMISRDEEILVYIVQGPRHHQSFTTHELV